MQYHRPSLCARNNVPSFLHLRPATVPFLPPFLCSVGYRGHTPPPPPLPHILINCGGGRRMMTRSLSSFSFSSSSFFSSSPSGTNVSEGGERREGKERGEVQKNVLPGMFSTSVRLSVCRHVHFVFAVARKNETFFKGGDKNAECLARDCRFEGSSSSKSKQALTHS